MAKLARALMHANFYVDVGRLVETLICDNFFIPVVFLILLCLLHQPARAA